MVTPRLGEPYTLTIQSVELYDEEGEKEEDVLDGCGNIARMGEVLARNPQRDHGGVPRRFTHTFSKVTSLKDTGKPDGEAGCIKIGGISPKIDGRYVTASIFYPNGYNPPVIT
jgi:hypothetical protein